MPIVNIELTEDEATRLDEVAKREKRARKYQASITLMERVDQILVETTLRQSLQLGPDQSPPAPDALAADLGAKS